MMAVLNQTAKWLILLSVIRIGLPSLGWTRQVEGRPTIPSDCTTNEIWVRDHAKTAGEWTSFCRSRNGKSSPSYIFWAPKFKFGRPLGWPSELQKERTTNWQTKDVQDVFWSIDRIPKTLWNPKIQGIYRMNKSVEYPNPGLYWNNVIILYDSAFQNEQYTTRVLSHELAHARFYHFSDSQKKDYAKASKFMSTELDSIDENFARNVEAYLFESETLRNKNRDAYEWIRRDIGANSGGKK